jgi:hypothetical protein
MFDTLIDFGSIATAMMMIHNNPKEDRSECFIPWLTTKSKINLRIIDCEFVGVRYLKKGSSVIRFSLSERRKT